MMSSGWDRWKSDTAKPLAQGGCHSWFFPPGFQSVLTTGMASICCQSSHAQSLSHLSPSHPQLTRQSSERGEGKSEEVSVCHYDVKSLISLLNPRGVFFNTHFFLSQHSGNKHRRNQTGGGHPWYQLSCWCNSWGYGTMVALQDKKNNKNISKQ